MNPNGTPSTGVEVGAHGLGELLKRLLCSPPHCQDTWSGWRPTHPAWLRPLQPRLPSQQHLVTDLTEPPPCTLLRVSLCTAVPS